MKRLFGRNARIAQTSLAVATTAFLAACGGADGGGQPAKTKAAAAAIAEPTCFFEHINFEGASFCIDSKRSEAFMPEGWNDRVSSVRIPAGQHVKLYEHGDYQGRYVTLAESQNVLPDGFNDLGSSFQVGVTSAQVERVSYAQSMLYDIADKELVLISGKEALILLNVTNKNRAEPVPTGKLQLSYPGENVVYEMPLTPPSAGVPESVPDEPDLARAFHATIPAEFVRAGLQARVLLNDDEKSVTTPRVGSGRPMNFVPISVTIAGVSGQVAQNIGPRLNALFPVTKVNVRDPATYQSSRVTSYPETEAQWNDAYGHILTEIGNLRVLEGAGPDDYYYGFIPKRSWGQTGLGVVGAPAAVGTDWPEQPDVVQWTIAHEVGHNVSLPHASCGGATGEPDYPYPDANLGKPGRYIWAFLSDVRSFFDPRPTDRTDIMGYCLGKVFSDFHYRKMQTFLTPSDKATINAAGKSEKIALPQEALLISGELGANDKVTLNPVKAFKGKVTETTGGDYVLKVVTAEGTREYPFSTRELDHDDQRRHFGFAIPNPGRILGLSVVKGSKTLFEEQSRVKAASLPAQGGQAESVQVVENDGKVKLTWESGRYPYLTVVWFKGSQRRTLTQDAANGAVELSTQGLAPGGSYELILSDGLNSVRLEKAR